MAGSGIRFLIPSASAAGAEPAFFAKNGDSALRFRAGGETNHAETNLTPRAGTGAGTPQNRSPALWFRKRYREPDSL